MVEPEIRIANGTQRRTRWLIGSTFALLFVVLSWSYWTQSWPAPTLLPTLHVHAGKTIHLDGVYYYAYLRSLAFDRDLDFANDYQLLGNPFEPPVHAETKRVGNVFTIGPALLWSPFLLVARVLSAFSPRWGPPDGSGELFQMFVFFGSCVYGFACCVLTYLIARRAYRRVDAWLAAMAALFSTPLYWHMLRQASYSHAISAFLAALLVFLWIRSYGSLRPVRWLLLGLTCGVGMSVRTTGIAHGLVPASELTLQLVEGVRARDRAALVRTASAGAAFAAGCLLGFLPQMLAWKTLYGKFLTVPQGEGFMVWGGSRYGAVLFSSWNGWAAWHPIVSVSVIGLIVTVARKRMPTPLRCIGAAALLVFAVEAFLNGAAEDWFAGYAYGGRRFTDCAVYVALGVAQLFSLLGDRTLHAWLARALRVAIPAFVTLAFSYFSLFLLNLHLNLATPVWGPVDLAAAWRSALVGAFDGIYAVTGNWGSIPMNWWYALSGRVSPARYDFADTGEPRRDPETFWPLRDGFVGLGGFGDKLSFEGRECRWLSAPEGRFTFLVRRPEDLHAKLELAAKIPGTRVRLSLRGEPLIDRLIGTSLQTLEFDIPSHLLVTGHNFVHVEQTIPAPAPLPIGRTGRAFAHDVTVRSAGWAVGMSGSIAVDGKTLPAGPRGITLFTIDRDDGTVTTIGTYDTFGFEHAVDGFAYAVGDLPEGTVVALAVADDASTHFSARGDHAIRKLGGARSLLKAYRASYALIGVKGAPPGTAVESFSMDQAVVANHGRPYAQSLQATIWHELRLAPKNPRPPAPPPPAPPPPAPPPPAPPPPEGPRP